MNEVQVPRSGYRHDVLANKGIVIGCFVDRNTDRMVMEKERSRITSESRKMDSDLMLTECLIRQILRFTT